MADRESRWGNYYDGGKSKHPLVLKMIDTTNQLLPSFNELFDEESFYVFAFFFLMLTIGVVVFLAKVVGIEIREYEVFPEETARNSPTTTWRPPNPFKMPWQHWRDIKQLAKNRNSKSRRE